MAGNLAFPPYNGSTVEVSIIHGGRTTVPTAYVFQNQIFGHDLLDIPCYSFFIENKKQGKRVLFDLGIMKLWKEKQPPAIINQIESAKAVMDIENDVVDQLKNANFPLESIDSIIWSHHHLDHTGDPSLFPESTALVVGPGFKKNRTTFPGYPKNPDAVVVQDAFEGRELVELEFASGLEIGGFPAIDYFRDGSFYILQAQGHTQDHISALARTSHDKFIFLGGDVAHHPGEYRPTPHLPLPEIIKPSPFDLRTSTSSCPGVLFQDIHPAKGTFMEYRTKPFYELSPLMNVSLHEAKDAVNKLEIFDASPDVFVLIAHDTSLLEVLPFFPETITNWDSADFKSDGTWRFLKDYENAVNLQKIRN